MLNSLAAKITKEGETEDKSFQEYTDWCTETRSRDLEIKTLSGSMATGEKDLADATAIRKKETADLAATE